MSKRAAAAGVDGRLTNDGDDRGKGPTPPAIAHTPPGFVDLPDVAFSVLSTFVPVWAVGALLCAKTQAVSTAYHEAGHTLFAFKGNLIHAFHNFTIVPSGYSAGRVVLTTEDDTYMARDQLSAIINLFVAGYLAQELIYGYPMPERSFSPDM